LPFNYGYKDNSIYIHSAPTGKKIDVLKKNNHVCFEIEYKVELVKHNDPCKWATRYRSVIGYGNVEIVTDEENKKAGLDIIMAHNGKSDDNIYQEKQLHAMVILKLMITSITGKQSSNWDSH
jgi:nitroimidazol reductase NimA-like FMN-containing flavoprotein (pyridoxamine 5'-phosphate oxidase superfamily)